jgi:hypothetical protein
MRRLLICLFLLSLAVLPAGCILSPRSVSGTVRYPDGRPGVHALVTMSTGSSTYSDGLGRYWLHAPAAGDTVSVTADNRYDGMIHAETCAGRSIVVVGREGATQDIVLDHCDPI